MIKLPFGWLPGHWGLKGKTRDRAQAEYELEGYELQARLLEIDSTDLDKDMWDLDLQWGRIDEYEYDMHFAGEDAIEQLEVNFKHHRISDREYRLELANLKQEPYVDVIEMNLEDGSRGYVELDWNDHFIKMLQTNGFKGTSEEDLVNKWFNQVCRTVLIQEMEDQDFGLSQSPGIDGAQDVIYRKDLKGDSDEQDGNNS